MGTHNTAQNVVGILYSLSPYAQRFVNSILQGTGAAFYGHYLGA